MKTQAVGVPIGIGRDSRMTYAFFFSIFLEFLYCQEQYAYYL